MWLGVHPSNVPAGNSIPSKAVWGKRQDRHLHAAWAASFWGLLTPFTRRLFLETQPRTWQTLLGSSYSIIILVLSKRSWVDSVATIQNLQGMHTKNRSHVPCPDSLVSLTTIAIIRQVLPMLPLPLKHLLNLSASLLHSPSPTQTIIVSHLNFGNSS